MQQKKSSDSNKFHVWIIKPNILIWLGTKIEYCNANAKLTKKLNIFERLNDKVVRMYCKQEQKLYIKLDA